MFKEKNPSTGLKNEFSVIPNDKSACQQLNSAYPSSFTSLGKSIFAITSEKTATLSEMNFSSLNLTSSCYIQIFGSQFQNFLFHVVLERKKADLCLSEC